MTNTEHYCSSHTKFDANINNNSLLSTNTFIRYDFTIPATAAFSPLHHKVTN